MVTNRQPVWLALHFPHLALDRLKHERGDARPRAVSDKRAGRQVIIDHNRAAGRAGVHTGMPASAALGLAGSLLLSTRDPRGEQSALERLAAWCYQYSSQVTIARQRNGLLLEIAASERLFGKPEMLAASIRGELKQLGYRAVSGVAPTPEAAHLAARHGLHIRSPDAIRKAIGTLGVDSLDLPPASVRALQKMGFRTIEEVLRLPGKALARRFGPATSGYLERLLGHRPDPCKSFRPPPGFSAGIDLPDTEHTRGLIFPLRRLVQELCGVLRAGDRGIQLLQVRLRLDKGERVISLALQRATRSESHLMLLLRERLERLQLPRPVRHVRLQASHFLPCSVQQHGLLKEMDRPSAETAGATIERLQARLGKGSVMGINARQDHRPEYSWSLRELDEPAAYATRAGRPAWLLPEPQPCKITEYRILTGPERIESGWWDGRDCRRDYFVVRDSNGGTLWAFQEYKPRPGWYLHGLFA